MAELDEKSLKNHLKKEELLSAYLICGNESYLKKLYTDKIASKAVDEAFESFNLQKFQGKNCTLQDVFDSAIMMPMMSEKRCIIVEDYKLESLGDNDIQLMRNFFSDLPQSTVMIFYQSSADFSLSKAKQAVDLFKKFGALCVLDKRTGNDLIKPLITSASKQNCTLTTQGAKFLVSLVGDDYNVLINELSKICHYVGSGEITNKQIEEIAIKTDETKVYYLTKALFSKDFDRAYSVLDSLFKQKIEPGYILGTIISSYVDMYRAKVSLVCGKQSDALKDDFSYKNTAFRLTNAARDSSRTELDTIRKCLDELSLADFKLKNSADDSRIVIEQLIVRLFLITNGERV